MRTERPPVLLYLLTAVVLAVSLAILVWLHQNYRFQRDRTLKDMQGFFPRDTVLKPAYDRNIRFGRLEELTRTFESSLFARRVIVTKMTDRLGEHPVHPFYLPATQPDWKTLVADWTRLPLVEKGETYGVLYVQENHAALNGVRWAIGGLAALLLLTLALLTARLMTQHSALYGAYVALNEKDRQLVRLERLSLAGQLAANILHDIKKPVANIKHSLADLEMMLRDLAGGSPALRNIKDQTDLFFVILRDLGLERFVRSKDADKEYVDVHETLRRSCALVQYERDKTEVTMEFNARPTPLVLAAPYRLIQVFSNLILNAYQAMRGQEGRLILRTRSENGSVIVEVADTGPGVPEAIRAKLFEPFESGKPEDEGTGLGLYISRNIVEEMGGSLTLAPSECGACFRVRLPLVHSDN
uniref:histidine kinase n=1 Tax=Anaerolinea thermolimosa TaxID=229919 RepID=A0A7C4PKQ2_9CHLR